MLLFCSISFLSHAQLPDVTTTETKTENQTDNTTNFLDLQANVYGDIFGRMLNVEEFKGVEDFMSLVDKMDASPKMKAKLIEQYQAYDTSLDPDKKELAKAQFNALLLKAMKEGQEKEKSKQ